MFSKALLEATYKNGRPGKPTEAHEQAEHHRFKKEFLFKNTAISKEIYASRLIQHFLIIKAIETQLNSLPGKAQSELSAFFALSYLDQLWRTPGMAQDLRLLDVNPDAIPENKIATATANYLEVIKKLPPKALLAHFLLHVVGFIHGGHIIQSKFIKPSNELTPYQIPAHQYDFSAATYLGEKSSVMALYGDMMKEVDKISLDEDEYAEVFAECNHIYETMVNIYDDLCTMHTRQPKLTTYSLAILSVSLFALALIIKLTADFLNPNNGSSYKPA